MTSSLSNLVDNLVGGIPKIKCKDYACFPEYEKFYDSLISFKRLSCNENCSKKINQNLKNWFENKFKFSNDKNTFILLLKKGFCPYEFMDDWEKFNEESLTENEKICTFFISLSSLALR